VSLIVRRGVSLAFVVTLVVASAMWGTAPATAVSIPLATVKPAVASGRLHSCALRSTGTVVCWGDNTYGELGNNSIVQSLVPVQVHGVGNKGFLSGVTAMTAGNGFSCALLSTKAVDCWGYGGDGEMGGGSIARSLTPVAVHGVGNRGLLTNVTAITAANSFACALLVAKTVICWGANDSGQLGIHSNTRALSPVAVHGVGNNGQLKGVAAVSAGSSTTPCALLLAKTVVCWGANVNGELGNNSTSESSVPTQVRGVGGAGFLSGVKAITGAGANSSCALFSNGGAACWGLKAALGINSSPGNSLTPVRVHGVDDVGLLAGVTAIVDHSDTPCALLSDGGVDCWGLGINRLGNSFDGPGVVPVQVHAVGDAGLLSGITSISAGELVGCAIATTRAVVCWGDNGNGELGDGTVANSGRPVQVHGLNDVGFLTL